MTYNVFSGTLNPTQSINRLHQCHRLHCSHSADWHILWTISRLQRSQPSTESTGTLSEWLDYGGLWN